MNRRGARVGGALVRRTDYFSGGNQDRWMVKLLRTTIDAELTNLSQELPRGARCLDVGCGEQPLRRRLEAMGLDYVSFDVSQNAGRNVDVLGAIDEQLPQTLLERGPFDLIVCTEVLEHVARWPEAFANLAALLKPRGRLLVTCPHIWLPHEEPSDFYRPTNWALAFHAGQCGLEMIRLARLGDGYDVLGTVLASTRARPAPGWWILWPLVWGLQILRKLALAALNWSWPRCAIELRTQLYLSVLGVFRKG